MHDSKAARLAAIRAANAAQRCAAAPAATVADARQAPTDAGAAGASSTRARAAVLLGAAVGVLAAVLVLPAWLPGMRGSLAGTEPKAYWYLARSSGLVAYALLWLAMAFGLLMTSKLARAWPGGPTAFDLHQHTSLVGLAFGVVHALVLLGDRYVAATPAEVLLPFAYPGGDPLLVGLGQLTLYGLVLVGLSFFVKGRLGRRIWRLIHTLSFAVFALALAHGLGSGSDGSALLVRALYWASGGSVLFLSVYRVLAALGARPVARPGPSSGNTR